MTTLKSIIENNGATLDENGNALSFNKGYQVSIKDLLIIKAYKLRKSTIKAMLANDYNLGIWIENGIAYIDYSQNFTRKRDALRIGKRNNQISIYDWKNQAVIYCK